MANETGSLSQLEADAAVARLRALAEKLRRLNDDIGRALREAEPIVAARFHGEDHDAMMRAIYGTLGALLFQRHGLEKIADDLS